MVPGKAPRMGATCAAAACSYTTCGRWREWFLFWAWGLRFRRRLRWGRLLIPCSPQDTVSLHCNSIRGQLTGKGMQEIGAATIVGVEALILHAIWVRAGHIHRNVRDWLAFLVHNVHRATHVGFIATGIVAGLDRLGLRVHAGGLGVGG